MKTYKGDFILGTMEDGKITCDECKRVYFEGTTMRYDATMAATKDHYLMYHPEALNVMALAGVRMEDSFLNRVYEEDSPDVSVSQV